MLKQEFSCAGHFWSFDSDGCHIYRFQIHDDKLNELFKDRTKAGWGTNHFMRLYDLNPTQCSDARFSMKKAHFKVQRNQALIKGYFDVLGLEGPRTNDL